MNNSNNIGYLMIGINVDIQRSDGRIHSAVISSIDIKLSILTVEWFEKGEAKGKEVDFQEVFQLNPHLMPTITKPEGVDIHEKTVQLKDDRDLEIKKVNETKKKPASRSQRRLTCVDEIEKIRAKREERRTNICPQICNETDVTTPYFDYLRMIIEYRNSNKINKPIYTEETYSKRIMVCVRTRPMDKKESKRNDIEIITVPSQNTIIIHEPKIKVDLTKYIENQNFRFDYVFNESCDNDLIYEYTTKPLVESIFKGGMATCFAYGQTGSGKTYTMCGEYSDVSNYEKEVKGIYYLAARDIFNLKETKYADLRIRVEVSYFEIYGGKIFDLLNERQKVTILEDKNNQIQIFGLKYQLVQNVGDVIDFLKIGAFIRSKGQTSQNEKSSRSHAVFQLSLRHINSPKLFGKLSLIDLAGNERGADTLFLNKEVRMEGAEINKSLLVLKECIRALGRKGAHLPFRGSKLTLVLRDSFINDKCRICMIVLVSPNFSSSENSLNTLRYADRLKELCIDSQDLEESELEFALRKSPNNISFKEIRQVEDELFIKHKEIIQDFFPIKIKRYSQMLNKTKNVDYNIEVYSRDLEDILNKDIEVLSLFRENLKTSLKFRNKADRLIKQDG